MPFFAYSGENSYLKKTVIFGAASVALYGVASHFQKKCEDYYCISHLPAILTNAQERKTFFKTTSKFFVNAGIFLGAYFGSAFCAYTSMQNLSRYFITQAAFNRAQFKRG